MHMAGVNRVPVRLLVVCFLLLVVRSLDATVCSAGQYKNAHSTCTNCPAGSFSARTGSEVCLPCESGKYSSAAGASQCTTCELGKDSMVGESSCRNKLDACRGLANAELDSVGDTCKCKAGYEMGFDTTSSPKRFKCEKCSKGKFSSQRGSFCEDCVAGKIQPGKGGKSCIGCGKGTYAAETGSQTCTDCPKGKYSKGTANSECQNCLPGKMVNAVKSDKESDCGDCSAGKYSLAGASGCTSCAAGTYSAAQSGGCEPCKAGKYANALSGATVCVGCRTGKFSSTFRSSSIHDCKDCPAGKASTVANSSTEGDCQVCAAGKISLDSGTTAGDSISSLSGQTSCQDCVAGTYAKWIDSGGHFTCTNCTEGKFQANRGQTFCTQCAPGKFSKTSVSTSASGSGSTECVDCNPGFYLDIVSETCIKCTEGKFSNYTDATHCTTCSTGKIADDKGLTECTDCAAGQQPHSNKSVCVNCLVGEYSNQNTQFVCTSCDSGKYQNNTGISQCQSCAPGRFSVPRSDRCFQFDPVCPRNFTNVNETVEKSKRTFDPRHQRGFYHVTIHDLHQNVSFVDRRGYGVTRYLGSKNEITFYEHDKVRVRLDLDSVARDPAGWQLRVNGDAYDLTERWHYIHLFRSFLEITVPGHNFDLVLHSSSNAEEFLQTIYVDTEFTHEKTRVPTCFPAFKCQAGTQWQWDGSSFTCEACADGLWSVDGHTCNACSSEGTTTVEGAKNSDGDCVCKRGYQLGADGNCTACPPGEFKNKTGNDSTCQSCPPETYAAAPGSPSCIECAQGMQASSDRQSCNLTDMFVQAENIPGFQSYNARIAKCSNATVHLCCALDEIWDGDACQKCESSTGTNFKTYRADNNECKRCHVCGKGQYMANCGGEPKPGTCVDCAIGKFKDKIDREENKHLTCTPCPEANTVTKYTGSKAREDCKCDKGYHQDESGVCVQCDSGKFKDFVGNEECTPCPNNEVSLAGSTDASDCRACSFGSGYDGADGTGSCSLCVAGKKAVNGVCEPCPFRTYQHLEGKTFCHDCPSSFCESEWYGTSDDVSRCGVSDPGCKQCPPQSQSVQGSNFEIDACLCDRGHSRSEADECVACPASTYQPLNDNVDECLPCPYNKTTRTNTTISVGQCVCRVNYRSFGDACAPCLAENGQFSDDLNSSECKSVLAEATTSSVLMNFSLDTSAADFAAAQELFRKQVAEQAGVDVEHVVIVSMGPGNGTTNVQVRITPPATKIEVEVAVTLPVIEDQWDSSMEEAFIASAAAAAGVHPADIVVQRVVPGAGGLRVEYVIETLDPVAAEAASAQTEATAMHASLAASGLTMAGPAQSTVATSERLVVEQGVETGMSVVLAVAPGNFDATMQRKFLESVAATLDADLRTVAITGWTENDDGTLNVTYTVQTLNAQDALAVQDDASFQALKHRLTSLGIETASSQAIVTSQQSALVNVSKMFTTVETSVEIEQTLEEFDEDARTAFIRAAAEAAGVPLGQIQNVDVQETADGNVVVTYTIDVADAETAQTIEARMNTPAISSELSANGLPGSTSLSTEVAASSILDLVDAVQDSDMESALSDVLLVSFEVDLNISAANFTEEKRATMTRIVADFLDVTTEQVVLTIVSEDAAVVHGSRRLLQDSTDLLRVQIEVLSLSSVEADESVTSMNVDVEVLRGSILQAQQILIVLDDQSVQRLPMFGKVKMQSEPRTETSSKMNCGAGEEGGYDRDTRQVQCTTCPVGKYSTDGISCVACDFGKSTMSSSARGPDQCVCSAGFFQTGDADESCRPCAAGSFSGQPASSACVECRVGEYSARGGSSSCLACPAGTFGATAGATGCTACNSGEWSQPNSTSCTTCAVCGPGLFSEGCGEGGTSSGSCRECAVGKFSASDNNVQCLDCDAGRAQPDLGQSSCQLCAKGTYAPDRGRGTCLPCQAGTASFLLGAVECFVCPVGTHQAYPGADSCLECDAGTMSNVAGASECTACSAGHYSASPGSALCNSCQPGQHQPHSGQTSCIECAAGQYSPEAKATACTTCSAGSYSDLVASATCKTCANGHYSRPGASACTQCTGCGFDQYVSGCGSQDPGDPVEGTCRDCPTGTNTRGQFQNMFEEGSCLPCPEGERNLESEEAGFFICVACEPGKYSAAGQNECQECKRCAPGQFSAGCGVLGNAGSCAPCSAGTFSPTEGFARCTECEAGMYQGLDGQAECLRCLAGQFSAAKGAEQCEVCVAGKFSALGSSVCTVCTPGEFSADSGAESCTPCAAGKFASAAGATVCIDCPASTYSSGTGSFSCTQCGSGKYHQITGQVDSSACVGCPAGSFASQFQSMCVACRPGEFSSNENASFCQECEPGFFSAGGSTGCTGCSPGTYAPESGASTCLSCVDGFYADSANSTSCQQCASGTHVLTPHILCQACEACEPGHEPAGCGGNLEQNNDGRYGLCSPCQPGKFRLEPSPLFCSACPAGKQAPLDGQTACTPCAPGQYQDVDGQALCKPCESGKFQAGAGATACELCPVGKQQRFEESSICDDCFPGKYAAQPGSLACAWCAAGTLPNVARTVCESCAAGTYRVHLRHTGCHSCDYCDDVMLEAVGCGFDSRGSCQPCAQCTNPNETRTVCDGTCLCVPGMTRSEAGVCELCAAGKAKAAPGDGPCTDCGAGRYSPAGSSACLDCAIGTYSALAVAPACVPCGENKTTENIGSSSEELCVCDLGFHHVASEPSLCNACLPGTWNDKLNHQTCSLCEAGKFLDGYAANSSEHCEVCAPNTYALAGADECEKCPSNGTSPTGSVSVGNCTCPTGAEGDGLGNCWCTAGYMLTGQDIPLCAVCAVGQFCSGKNHTATCTTEPGFYCPAGSSSAGGSQCPWGYFCEGLDADKQPCTSLGHYCPSGASQELQCPAGTFSNQSGQSVCQECPAHATTSLGATNRSDCACVPGFTGENGGTCQSCALGKYKAGTGSAECTDCGAGTYSFVQAATTSDTCSPCIANSISPAGSIFSTACECNAGYTGPDGGPCTGCGAGTFKGVLGSEPCTDCPSYSSSPVASDSSSDCTCNLGYYGAYGGPCTACVAGKFSTTPSATSETSCRACVAGKFSTSTAATDSTACTSCEQGKYSATVGATSESSCVSCENGQSSPAGSDAQSDCYNCPAGKYSSQAPTGILACTDCAAGSYALFPKNPYCRCCLSGTYSGTLGLATKCTFCPSGKSHSSECATSVSQCVDCVAGKYSSQQDLWLSRTSLCASCPAGKSSPAGSDASSDCQNCQAGKSSDAGSTCVDCAAGKYSSSTGASYCSNCAGGKTSPAGSDASSDCTDCPVAKYSSAGSTCTNCPHGKTSPAGSDASSDCTNCAAGKYSPGAGQGCTNCAAGKASGSTGQTAESSCQNCEAGEYSSAAASSCTDCSANTKSAVGASSCTACSLGRVFYIQSSGDFFNPAGYKWNYCSSCTTSCGAYFQLSTQLTFNGAVHNIYMFEMCSGYTDSWGINAASTWTNLAYRWWGGTRDEATQSFLDTWNTRFSGDLRDECRDKKIY